MDWNNPWIVGIGTGVMILAIGFIAKKIWNHVHKEDKGSSGPIGILAKGKIKGLKMYGNKFIGIKNALVLEKGGEDLDLKDNIQINK